MGKNKSQGVKNRFIRPFREWLIVAALALTGSSGSAQLFERTTTTNIAGPNEPGRGSRNGAAGDARFHFPYGVAQDSAGTIFIADTRNHVVRRLGTNGIVTTLAGQSGVSGTVDGVGTNALLNNPYFPTVLPNGDLIISEKNRHNLRRITQTGEASLFAGIPGVRGSQNGHALQATFNFPGQTLLLADGSLLVPDGGNHLIRKITPAGQVSTIAGQAGIAGTSDGPGNVASLNWPVSIAMDPQGRLYISQWVSPSTSVRRMDTDGSISTIPLATFSNGSLVSVSLAASIEEPFSLATHPSGDILIIERLNQRISLMSPSGLLTNFAGTNYGDAYGAAPDPVTSIDGPGARARFFRPSSISIGLNGTVLVSDADNHQIRSISSNGFVTTIAGQGRTAGTNDGSGANARFYNPRSVAADSSGQLFVADAGNHVIRAIATDGTVSVFAGRMGTTGDVVGAGPDARFSGPQAIVAGPDGNLYVADTGNNKVKRLTPAGQVSTIATLTSPSSFVPTSLALDAATNIFVASSVTHAIGRINPDGTLQVIAGLMANPGLVDATGSVARFRTPNDLKFGPDGHLYVADYGNDRIRRVATNGVVTTAVTNFQAGAVLSADGPASVIGIRRPSAIEWLTDGRLAITPTSSFSGTPDNIKVWNTNGTISTLAGRPYLRGEVAQTKEMSANGTPTNATFGIPYGLTHVPGRGLVVVDPLDHSIRLVTLPSGPVSLPSFLSTPAVVSNEFGRPLTLTFQANSSGTVALQWRHAGTNLTDGGSVNGGRTTSLSLTAPTFTDSGDYAVVLSNEVGSVTGLVATVSVFANPPTFPRSDAATSSERLAAITLSPSNTLGTSLIRYQWSSNGVAIAGATNQSLTLRQIDFSHAGAYILTATNLAGMGFFTNILTVIPQRIGEALDAPELPWTSSSGASWSNSWVLTSQPASDGIDALRTGRLSANEYASVHTTLEGPGLLKFKWRTVDTSQGGIIRFESDFNVAFEKFLLSDWIEETVNIPLGSRKVSWLFRQLSNTTDPQVGGFLDSVRFYSTASPPKINSYFAGIQTNGGYGFRLTGIPGAVTGVEASTNLVAWENLGIFTNVTGQSFFNDPSNTNRPARFYRLKQIP